MNDRQRHFLETLAGEGVQWQCPLSRHTSFAIGGPAEALVRAGDERLLQGVLRLCRDEGIPWRVIGRGTNLLVADRGVEGVVLRLIGDLAGSGERDLADGAVMLSAGGGAGFARVCREACERGLAGLEFGCGIPGTVGGAVCMDAGAWGVDSGSLLRSIRVVDADGAEEIVTRTEDFTYRWWKGLAAVDGRGVITLAELCLRPGDRTAILARVAEYDRLRRDRQPHQHASAGSFFKNPPGDSAGRLIEACGLKGLRVGAAMISPLHANFLVNTGGATAAEVLRLMRLVQERVLQATGVALEAEVHFLGEMP